MKEENFIEYVATRHWNDDPEHMFTLRLPKDKVGWFHVELGDGRKFDIHNLEDVIDTFISTVGVDYDGEVRSDSLKDDEYYEENRQIELKQELRKTVEDGFKTFTDGRPTSEQIDKLVNDVWGKYQIKPPHC